MKPSVTSLLSTSSSSSSTKPYFITTPIFYVNSVPHIGHLYTALLADAHHRYKTLVDPRRPAGVFSTGTDEHGLKVQQAADRLGLTPGQMCHQVSGQFRQVFDRCGVAYTDYIRTTEHRHKVYFSGTFLQSLLLLDLQSYTNLLSMVL